MSVSRHRREEEKRRRVNPRAREQRTGLRTLGLFLMVAGGILFAIGLTSFFSAFNEGPGGGPPRYFWCTFVGAPLLAIGLALLKWGYIGPIGRYVAGETAPIARDAIDYLADGIGESIRDAQPKQAAESTGTVRERLERLEALRKDALIDDQEFAAQKERILADL